MNTSKYLIRLLFCLFPKRNLFLYQESRRYIDAYNAENNDDPDSNGELRLMREYLPKSQIVFDVGANVGLWARKALELNPDINLHCFEPSSATFSKLLENTSSFVENVVLNNFGLSSTQQRTKLLIFDDLPGMNSLYLREGLEDGWNITPQSKSEIIDLYPLDAYCSQNGVGQIDFLKADIEGHELELFRGAANLLKNYRIQLIQFEYGGCNIDSRILLKDIFNFFSQFPKYKFYKIYPDKLRPVKRYDQRLENFQYQNWAIIYNGK